MHRLNKRPCFSISPTSLFILMPFTWYHPMQIEALDIQLRVILLLGEQHYFQVSAFSCTCSQRGRLRFMPLLLKMNAAPLTELKKSGSDCLPVQYHKENPVLKQNIFSPLVSKSQMFRSSSLILC